MQVWDFGEKLSDASNALRLRQPAPNLALNPGSVPLNTTSHVSPGVSPPPDRPSACRQATDHVSAPRQAPTLYRRTAVPAGHCAVEARRLNLDPHTPTVACP